MENIIKEIEQKFISMLWDKKEDTWVKIKLTEWISVALKEIEIKKKEENYKEHLISVRIWGWTYWFEYSLPVWKRQNVWTIPSKMCGWCNYTCSIIRTESIIVDWVKINLFLLKYKNK